jgi:hypothetical protein
MAEGGGYCPPLEGDYVVIEKMSFRTNVRNLNMLILLVLKISPFGRNDSNTDCDTVSGGAGGGKKLIYFMYTVATNTNNHLRTTPLPPPAVDRADHPFLYWCDAPH